jgi:phosphatidylglycerol:prolipoprotein diacylglycerol transferase
MFPFIEFLSIRLPTYGIMMTLGCSIAVALSLSRCERYLCSKDNAVIIMACAGGMAMIGAKLLYLLASVPADALVGLIKTNPLAVIADGGQVFYGGLLGGACGAYVGCRITRERANGYLLAILPAVPLGHAFGRIGCFLAGCCYGIPYRGLGAVVFRRAIGGAPNGVALFPVQLLEASLNVAIFLILLRVSKKSASGLRLALAYAGMYAIVRFVLEYLRYDSVRGSAFVFSTSQWISLALAFPALIGSLLRIRSDRGFGRNNQII